MWTLWRNVQKPWLGTASLISPEKPWHSPDRTGLCTPTHPTWQKNIWGAERWWAAQSPLCGPLSFCSCLFTYLIPSKDFKIHYKFEKLLLIYFRISFRQFLVHAKPLSTSRPWQRLWHLPETPFPTPQAFSGLCPTHSLGLAFHLMAPLLEHLFGALTTAVE